MRGASSRAVTPPPSPASRQDARAGSFRDHQHMHLTPDTEPERYIKPDRARIAGVTVQKGRLAPRDHFAHDMADQRAREPAAAAIGPCRDAADLGHAGDEDALSRHREEPALFADSKEGAVRSEEHTSELQSLMRISYAVFCLKKKKKKTTDTT